MQYTHPSDNPGPCADIISRADSISHLLVLENHPTTVLPLLRGLERSAAADGEKDMLYAYHLGHSSAEVRHVCARALSGSLDENTPTLPILSAAYAREVDSSLRSTLHRTLGPHTIAATIEPVRESLRYEASARTADLTYLRRDGATRDVINRLLLQILLDSNPHSQLTAFEVLDSFTAQFTPGQRNAALLSCAYFLGSDSLRPRIAVSRAIRVLERLRPGSAVVCEVLASYLNHRDSYVRARAACALVYLNREKSADCAAVLGAALIDVPAGTLSTPKIPELKASAFSLRKLRGFIRSVLKERAAVFYPEIEALEEGHQQNSQRVVEAYLSSIARCHSKFDEIDRRLGEWSTGIVASMTCSHLDCFAETERTNLFGTLLFMLDRCRAIAVIAQPIVEQLPEQRGFEQATFRCLAQLVFAEAPEDLRSRACLSLVKLACRDAQFIASVRAILDVVADEDSTEHFRRRLEALREILGNAGR